MLTEFALLVQTCGLSQREAAGILGCRIDTVKSWSSGRNVAPVGVLLELKELAQTIARVAAEAVLTISEKVDASNGVIELTYAADDYEAQQLGWPCVGAQRAMLGRVVASLPANQIILSPRGLTVAGAAAAAMNGD